MSDIAALVAAVEAAETAKADLVDQRRANRENLSPNDFKAYNESTRQEQKDVQAAVTKVTKALQAALTTVRSEALNVAVGTLHETNTPGGTS